MSSTGSPLLRPGDREGVRNVVELVNQMRLAHGNQADDRREFVEYARTVSDVLEELQDQLPACSASVLGEIIMSLEEAKPVLRWVDSGATAAFGGPSRSDRLRQIKTSLHQQQLLLLCSVVPSATYSSQLVGPLDSAVSSSSTSQEAAVHIKMFLYSAKLLNEHCQEPRLVQMALLKVSCSAQGLLSPAASEVEALCLPIEKDVLATLLPGTTAAATTATGASQSRPSDTLLPLEPLKRPGSPISGLQRPAQHDLAPPSATSTDAPQSRTGNPPVGDELLSVEASAGPARGQGAPFAVEALQQSSSGSGATGNYFLCDRWALPESPRDAEEPPRLQGAALEGGMVDLGAAVFSSGCTSGSTTSLACALGTAATADSADAAVTEKERKQQVFTDVPAFLATHNLGSRSRVQVFLPDGTPYDVPANGEVAKPEWTDVLFWPIRYSDTEDGLFLMGPAPAPSTGRVFNLSEFLTIASPDRLVLGASDALVLDSSCSGVLLSRLTIQGGVVVCYGTDAKFQGVQFRNCCLVALQGAEVELSHCHFAHAHDSSGLSVFAADAGTTVKILHTCIKGGTQGVFAQAGAELSSVEMKVSGCTGAAVAACGAETKARLQMGSIAGGRHGLLVQSGAHLEAATVKFEKCDVAAVHASSPGTCVELQGHCKVSGGTAGVIVSGGAKLESVGLEVTQCEAAGVEVYGPQSAATMSQGEIWDLGPNAAADGEEEVGHRSKVKKAAEQEVVGLVAHSGAAATLCDVTVKACDRGVFAHSSAVVTCIACTLSSVATHAFVVESGACGNLQGCSVFGAGESGLLVAGQGTEATATRCEVRLSGEHGAQVVRGGTAHFEHCQFENVKGCGVFAHDASCAHLSHCSTSNSHRAGFSAHGKCLLVLESCESDGDGVGCAVVGGARAEVDSLMVITSRGHGLHVDRGAMAELTGCSVMGAARHALHVAGAETSINATRCKFMDGCEGGVAVSQALVGLRDCEFTGNGGFAVRAYMNAAVTVSESSAKPHDDTAKGFCSETSANLMLVDCSVNGPAEVACMAEGGEMHCERLQVVGEPLCGFKFTSSAHGTLNSCEVLGADGCGVHASDTRTVLEMVGCDVQHCKDQGVCVRNGARLEATSCKFQHNGRAGVAVAEGASVSLASCGSEANWGHGLCAESGSTVSLTDCTSSNDAWTAVWASGCTVNAVGVAVDGSKGCGHGFFFSNCERVGVRACTASNCRGNGLSAAGSVTDVKVDGLQVSENSGSGVCVEEGARAVMKGVRTEGNGLCGFQCSGTGSALLLRDWAADEDEQCLRQEDAVLVRNRVEWWARLPLLFLTRRLPLVACCYD